MEIPERETEYVFDVLSAPKIETYEKSFDKSEIIFFNSGLLFSKNSDALIFTKSSTTVTIFLSYTLLSFSTSG